VAHGTKKCVLKGLQRLSHETVNTSAVERSNLTARSMNAYQVRKSLAFARRAESRSSLAWWCVTVSNFARVNRSLAGAVGASRGATGVPRAKSGDGGWVDGSRVERVGVDARDRVRTCGLRSSHPRPEDQNSSFLQVILANNFVDIAIWGAKMLPDFSSLTLGFWVQKFDACLNHALLRFGK
jgi:hypothetical protein